eukprot:TRINITY_DN81064_c0_g1_i1.p1 TRINITY_DN81064_c0_g1~~TRINITY_DN81064_c0_g1_i1.p1  ORF type:complete len:159 (-),score=14.15 TRINITY_DN81064_c0_g1_i1:107-583(-)
MNPPQARFVVASLLLLVATCLTGCNKNEISGGCEVFVDPGYCTYYGVSDSCCQSMQENGWHSEKAGRACQDPADWSAISAGGKHCHATPSKDAGSSSADAPFNRDLRRLRRHVWMPALFMLGVLAILIICCCRRRSPATASAEGVCGETGVPYSKMPA